ncbi:hypothetical protein [Novosphingobium sp. Chol11]|uniref:hypothetical protein n=1 Tax=Novosphingobium sp. Chol11 TaxID=1385763 RepID=UPI0025D20A8D|nr:hypothetical protein [Novosphingobium sp. Chol11]
MKTISVVAATIALLANPAAALAESNCHNIPNGQNYSFNVTTNTTYQFNAPASGIKDPAVTYGPCTPVNGSTSMPYCLTLESNKPTGSVTMRAYNAGCVVTSMQVSQAGGNVNGVPTGKIYTQNGGKNSWPCVSNSNSSPSEGINLPNTQIDSATSHTLNGYMILQSKSNDSTAFPLYNVLFGGSQFSVSIWFDNNYWVNSQRVSRGIQVCLGYSSLLPVA